MKDYASLSYRDDHNMSIIRTALTLTGIVTENAVFSGKIINELSCREAMGLTSKNCIGNIDRLDQDYQFLSTLASETLVKIIDDKASVFNERYAAANLLGLRGDTRIDVLNPCMINVPAARVTLGLEKNKVRGVASEFRQYGVTEEWISKECPAYKTFIPDFALAKYCVTNWEYLCFLSETGYEEFPDSWRFGTYPRQRANYPVYTVSFGAAKAYAAWLSRRTGRNFHLPSEAQWEYAAGGACGLEYPWGNVFLPDHCNSVESGIIDATPVGIFPHGAGPFGHLDMAGNVEEYTDGGYKPYEGNDAEIEDDLRRTQGESYPVARGGSFTRFRDLCRTRRRHGRYDSELYVMGFRLAETIAR